MAPFPFRWLTAYASFAFLCLIASAAFAVTSQPFTAQNLVRLKRVSDPAVSPDEHYLAFTLRETDMDADRGRTDIWLLDLHQTNAAPVRLTSHSENDSYPVWTRDSRTIYFLSSRSGSQQVWRLSLNGGEAQPVTDLPVAVTTFALSPTQAQLAITLDVFPDCPNLMCTVTRIKKQTDSKARGMVFDRTFVRHWDTWDDGTQTHLFVVNLKNGIASDAPVDLSKNLDADIPSKPFGDATEYSFSPDGAKLAFNARIKGQSEAWSTNFDIYEVATSGAGTPINLTVDNLAWDAQPIYSDDGHWLAWRAMDRPGFEADRFHIVLLNRKTGERRALTQDWDRSADIIAFSKDSESIYALADHLGQHPLWSVDVKSGRPKQLTEKGRIEALSVGRNAIYVSRSALNFPADLYAIRTTGGNAHRLSQVNADALQAVHLNEAEQFTFAGANDATVYAHIVRPSEFDANKKYPVAFFVHGGPQSSYGNAWSYRWNPQTYAGAGYAFIAIDFHGSPGYGQAFTDAVSGDWGGKPLEDLKKGLAAALKKYSWLDANRVCALGASYGGYMMNWIAGTWSEPFKCIVNHAGIVDSRFMTYSTEELWFEEWEHGGPQYEKPENYEKYNPLNYVAKWRVPELVIAGQKDYRVPYSQSIATFTALQRRGIPSRLVIFPNENHWILKPADSIQWHEEVERWLKEWLSK